ncbi:hypothetical protein BH09PSE6_BH09PSE6_15560 [soil metagenome]
MSRFLTNESHRQVLAHLRQELDRAQSAETDVRRIVSACEPAASEADLARLTVRLDDAHAVVVAARCALDEYSASS